MKRKGAVTVGLAGTIAAGKSTASEFVAQELGFEIIRTSDVLRRHIEARGDRVDDHSLQEYGATIMTGDGAEAFCKSIMDMISPGKNYVIDAIRPISHYEYFKQYLDRFSLLYVFAPYSVRAGRYISRGKARESTQEGFLARNNHPVEQQVTHLMELADGVLVNQDLGAFQRQLITSIYNLWYSERPVFLQELIEMVRAFHSKHGYDIDTGNKSVMSLRVGLMIEELGEIHACISKGLDGIEEEHADLLYLLLGNCVTLGFDLEEAFLRKHEVNMKRKSKRVGTLGRVSGWEHVE